MPITPNDALRARSWFNEIDRDLVGQPPVNVKIQPMMTAEIVQLAIHTYTSKGWIVKHGKEGTLIFTVPEDHHPRD